jgi:archaemetzincin
VPYPTSPARGLAFAGAALILLLAQGLPLLRAYDFVPPTREQALAALGPLDNENSANRRLLTVDDDFAPIEAPGPGDWLAAHDDEPGQTYANFQLGDAQRVDDTRKVIYLQPLGEFAADSAPSLEALRDYAAAFFQLDVILLPADMTESAAFEPRINRATKKPQLRSTAILTWLHERLPDDAFCMIAVTMADLYPDPSWNFVYGQASPAQRTGVFSFARHDAMFFGKDRPDDFDALMLRRSGKTLVHEIAHIFGLAHCIYFRCVENGSNHEAESDSRPHHLCPICLRKLRYATGADLEARYRDLAYFYSQHIGWEEEEAWVRRQLAKLRAEPFTPPLLRDLSTPRFDSPRHIIPSSSPDTPRTEPAVPVPPPPSPEVPPSPAPQSAPDTPTPPVPTPVAVAEPLVAQRR